MRSVRPPPPRVDPDPFFGRVVRAGDVHRAATPLGGYGGGRAPQRAQRRDQSPRSYWNLVRPSRTAPRPTAASRRYAAAAALRDMLLSDDEIERAGAYQIGDDVRDRFADAADDGAAERAEQADERVGWYPSYRGGAADLPRSSSLPVATAAAAVVVPAARRAGEALGRRRVAAIAAHGETREGEEEAPAAKRPQAWQLVEEEKAEKKRRKTEEDADAAQKYLEEEECKSGENTSDGIIASAAASADLCAAPATKFHRFLVEDDSTEDDSRAAPAPTKQPRRPPEEAQVVEGEAKKTKTTEDEGSEKKRKSVGTDISSSAAVAPKNNRSVEGREIENDTKRGDTAAPQPRAAQAAAPPVRRRRSYDARASTFPHKFHRVLDAIEHDGRAHVLSWLPHGRAFKVHDPKEFTALAARHYFGMAKATSFTRQLNIWGFTRIISGADKGGYYHPNFLRNRIDLIDGIERKETKGTGIGRKKEIPGMDPNFYKMPPVEPMPPSESAKLAKLNAQSRISAVTRARRAPTAPPARPLHPPFHGPNRFQDRSSFLGSGGSGFSRGQSSSSSDRFCDASQEGTAVAPAAADPHRITHRQPPPVRYPPQQHQRDDGGRHLFPGSYPARTAAAPPPPPALPPFVVRSLTPEEAEASAAVAAARSHRVAAAAAARRAFEHDPSGGAYHPYPPPSMAVAARGPPLPSDRARFAGEAHAAAALRAADGGLHHGLEYSRFPPQQQAAAVPARRRRHAAAEWAAAAVAGEDNLRVRAELELRRREIYRVEEEATLALRYAREEATLLYQPRHRPRPPPRLPPPPCPRAPPSFRVAAGSPGR